MKKTPPPLFGKRYREALRDDLAGKVGGPRTAAAQLGSEAAGQGMDRLDVSLLHASAMEDENMNPGAGFTEKYVARTGSAFLRAALGSVLKAEKKTAAITIRISFELRNKTRALVIANKRVQRETSRRVAGDKKRIGLVRHYNELLAREKLERLAAKQLARRILLAQEDERREISRDLHDEIAQTLAGINVRLATLKMASAIDSTELRKRIIETQRLVGRSVRIVHRYARELRPSMLDDLGLVPALSAYIREMPGRRTLDIRLVTTGTIDSLDNAGRTALYRVAQEALRNVIRHAHAKSAVVSLGMADDVVRLEVFDDGRSFSPGKIPVSPRSKRLGMIGMRERVEMLGGTLQIIPTPGKGTLVRAEIPFRMEPQKVRS